MSTYVMAACWPLQIPPTQKSVLISLADNANDQGDCWPAISTICERTCFRKTAVIAAIQWLEDHGYLVADRTNGRHTRYCVQVGTWGAASVRTGPAGAPARQTNRPAKRTGPADTPARQTDRFGKQTGPADEPDPSGKRTGPVRQTDTNRQEPSRTVTKKKQDAPALDFSTWPAAPSPNVLADWLAMRRKKRADVSDTVMRAMGRELHTAAGMGWSVDECLTECVLRNWQGLKAEWLQQRGAARISSSPASNCGKTMGAILALEDEKYELAETGNSLRLANVADTKPR